MPLPEVKVRMSPVWNPWEIVTSAPLPEYWLCPTRGTERLQSTDDEARGLRRHTVCNIRAVSAGGWSRGSTIADRVARRAQVDGLWDVERADGDLRGAGVAQKPIRRFAEQGHCGHVGGYLGRHGRGYERGRNSRGHVGRGDKARNRRALREPAKHDSGAGTVRGH